MNIRRVISGLVVAAVLLATASDVQAQKAPNRRSSGVASLGEMGCRRIGGMGGYRTINEDIPIGREIFRAVAYLGDGSFLGTGIDRDNPTKVACRLAPVNAAPQFKTLTLSLGLREDSSDLDGSVIVRLFGSSEGKNTHILSIVRINT